MKTDPGLQRCFTYINCEINPPDHPDRKRPRYRAVTISRQTGSGAHAVAEHLSELLQEHAREDECPWTVFDRNLVEKVLEDHNLPSRLAQFMPEDRISEMSDTMDELFGLHPPSWSLVRDVSDTILHIMEKGNVILIGRAAAVIGAKIEHVFHVRLVGSIEKRLEHLQEVRGLSKQAAADVLYREDRGRERYLKKYFGKNIHDPLLYHMVINTDLISYRDAAQMISAAVMTTKPALAEIEA